MPRLIPLTLAATLALTGCVAYDGYEDAGPGYYRQAAPAWYGPSYAAPSYGYGGGGFWRPGPVERHAERPTERPMPRPSTAPPPMFRPGPGGPPPRGAMPGASGRLGPRQEQGAN